MEVYDILVDQLPCVTKQLLLELLNEVFFIGEQVIMTWVSR